MDTGSNRNGYENVNTNEANDKASAADGKSLRNRSAMGELPEVELVANDPTQKNWKGIAVALIVIIFICSLIGLAIVFTSPRNDDLDTRAPIHYTDMFVIRKMTASVVYQWCEDSLLYYSRGKDILKVTLSSLMDTASFFSLAYFDKTRNSKDFSVSADMSIIMLPYDQKKEFRHSSFSKYRLISIKNPTTNADLSTKPSQNAVDTIQFALWGPLSTQLVFVKDNRIFYTKEPFSQNDESVEEITKSLPSGKDIRYGTCDWLYEEEVIRTNQALWWNAKGTHLAFLSFNVSQVSTFQMKMHGNFTNYYGYTNDLKYPKAGETRPNNNPIVHLYVHSITEKTSKRFALTHLEVNDGYITFVKWYNESALIVGSVNREQTTLYLSLCEWNLASCFMIYDETMSRGWTDWFKQTNQEPIMDPKEGRIFIIMDREDEQVKDSFRNVAELKLSNMANKRATRLWSYKMNLDIEDLLSVKDGEHFLLLMAHPHVSEKNIYYFNSRTQEFRNLTGSDPACLFSTLTLSKSGSVGILECKGPEPPSYYLVNITSNYTMQIWENIENNQFVRDKVKRTRMPVIEYINITVRKGTPEELVLNGRMHLPPDIKKDYRLKYPLLLVVYAGPSRPQVVKKFDMEWYSYVVSRLGYVVLQVDGRGINNRGREFHMAVHKQLGVKEVKDQYDALVSFMEEKAFVDPNRTGVFGWSYGGFAAAKLLSLPDSILRCGISVAPVTDFRQYDTAYTERFMTLLSQNPIGYEKTNISALARNFKGKGFFLVHGSGDDNVHISNTYTLTRALIEADVPFQMMVFPDDNHSMNSGNSRLYLNKMMIQFMVDCFNGTRKYDWSFE